MKANVLMKEKEIEQIGNSFDDDACSFCDDFKKSGLVKSSQILLDELTTLGIRGKRLLDLGCGVGSFSFKALERGVTSTAGFDLSSIMIGTASRLSEERGVKERASFRRDDAAKAALPESEIVVLDKSMCCYPNIDELLDNSSNASREYYSFILPRSDTKISRIIATFVVSIGNLLSKITSQSRTYIHNIRKIDRVLTSRNFERVFRETSGMWLILIYRRIP